MSILDTKGLGERRIKVRGLMVALLIMIVSLPLLGEISLAGEEARPKNSQKREAKILITADQVEFDSQKEIATYVGRVTVTQENTSLSADRIEVHFLNKGQNIDLIKAFGHIRVVQGDRIITAQEGVYYQRDRKVVLTGNPITRQGVNCISGDKIIYFWNEGKALVEGNVKATIAVDKEKMEMMRPK